MFATLDLKRPTPNILEVAYKAPGMRAIAVVLVISALLLLALVFPYLTAVPVFWTLPACLLIAAFRIAGVEGRDRESIFYRNREVLIFRIGGVMGSSMGAREYTYPFADIEEVEDRKRAAMLVVPMRCVGIRLKNGKRPGLSPLALRSKQQNQPIGDTLRDFLAQPGHATSAIKPVREKVPV